MTRAAVDLPEPDSPTTATVRRRWMSKLTSCSTVHRAIGGGDVAHGDDRQLARPAPAAAPPARELRTAQSDLV